MFEDLIEEFQPFARELLLAAGQAGLAPRVTSTRRSPTQQARLYRRWLSGLSPLPAAPPGTSAHEFGYAFDMVVSPFEALSDVGYTWQQWGGIWGGDQDPVHFQFPGFVAPNPSPTREPEFGPTPGIAQVFSPGPWWAPIPSYVDLLKGGTHYTHEAMCYLLGKNWC
jgi:hypothetical protein